MSWCVSVNIPKDKEHLCEVLKIKRKYRNPAGELVIFKRAKSLEGYKILCSKLSKLGLRGN